MTHNSRTTAPSLRRDLVAINLALIVAALVFGVGHIPGVVNSATLIAVGSSLWAAFKLVSVVRRLLNPIATPAETEPISIVRTSTPHRIPAIRLVADVSRHAS
ncbi:hypothetical protein AB0O58_19760 [Rhodococcus sp. NPDC080181]|jgi:hypothetical protein|uniref:hypothetical protein n=1 Tax=Rhodococcus sp. NPDC080181 TaxID=3155292 RepID=UPI00344F93FA